MISGFVGGVNVDAGTTSNYLSVGANGAGTANVTLAYGVTRAGVNQLFVQATRAAGAVVRGAVAATTNDAAA